MLNNINSEDILKDLQEGLAPVVLSAELHSHGKLLLEKEIENLIGSETPRDYAYLRDTAQEVLRFNSKIDEKDVGFDKIESEPIQGQLKRALTVFGAAAFYAAADKLYEQKAAAIINRDLLGVMRTTALKQLNCWVSARYSVKGEACYNINYTAIKKARVQKLVRDLAKLYGQNKVGRQIQRQRDTLKQGRIASLVECQDVPLDPVKAFILAQETIAKTAAPKHSDLRQKL